MDHGIYLLSGSSALNKNGLIILEFYASSQSLIKDLNTKYPIYLKNKGSKVTLVPIEILKGEMKLTQVVFKPGKGLKVGEEYSLVISNLPSYETQPVRTDSDMSVRFKINNTSDFKKPVFTGLPIERKKTMDLFGCGPASWVYFNIPALEDSEYYVRIRVQGQSSGMKTEFILKPEEGMIKVGHGMCSGAIFFKNNRKYTISFQLMDQSGNISPFTRTITFTSPDYSS